MAKRCDPILRELPRFQKGAEEIREILLANLAMISEIPAPTFGEGRRVEFIQQRMSECGLLQCSTDEAGNAAGMLPGEKDNNLLVVAHADTLFPEKVDHTVTLRARTVTGPGVADNGLGLAALVTMPTLLEHLGVKLNASLFLMATSRSLGRGNLEGLHFFLTNRKMPLRAAVCVEGVPLGRLSFTSIGMLRGEVRVEAPEEYDWTRFGARNAIYALNEVINRINAIRLPRRPRTSIVIGAVNSGTSYDTMPAKASLLFEIRSESGAMVQEIRQSMNDIAEEVAASSGVQVVLDVFARRKPGGLPFGHPLPRQCRAILRSLRVKPRILPSFSELSAFIEHGVPAATIGLTNAERMDEPEEKIEIAPIFAGMAQLVAILLAIDGGYCDED